MNRFFNIFPLFAMGLFGSDLYAGADSSGGGQLLRDGGNPWFIERKIEVFYCIKIDENNFPINKTQATQFVERTLSYWDSQFERMQIAGFTKIGVGEQYFTQVDCSETEKVDLRINFGVLSTEESKVIVDPRKYLGFTHRESYDSKTLRGKGFIYIAPESGPLKPLGDRIIAKPWSQCRGCLLERVLMHEFGHVFGVQHDGNINDLMNEGYPENLVSIDNSFKPDEESPMPQLASPRDNLLFKDYVACNAQSAFSWFEVPSSHNCIELEMESSRSIEVFSRAPAGTESVHVGRIVLDVVQKESIDIVKLFIPKGQVLIPIDESDIEETYLNLAGAEAVVASGYFQRDGDSEKKRLSLNYRPNSFNITGALDVDRFITLLSGQPL